MCGCEILPWQAVGRPWQGQWEGRSLALAGPTSTPERFLFPPRVEVLTVLVPVATSLCEVTLCLIGLGNELVSCPLG